MAAKGINLLEVRLINKSNIVRTLQEKGPLTKQELTRTLNLSLATVVTIIKELVEEGIVEQGEVLASTGGRKPVVYQIVENAKMALGVSLTAHHIRIVLVNWCQTPIDVLRETILYENTDEYWHHLKDKVDELLARTKIVFTDKNFLGINILVDSRILPKTDYEGIIPEGIFEGLDMDYVRGIFEWPVHFCNSVKAAAFSNIGKVSARNTCAYIQLDRTIGGAIIANGVFWGLSHRTGEFGHMYMGENDRKCTCGNYGCMQTYCSSDLIREESGMELDEFFEELGKGNRRLTPIWNMYKKNLVQAIYNLRVIFDIDVMLGGEMAPFLRERREELVEVLKMLDIYKEDTDYLLFSYGGEYDAAIGGALILMEQEDVYKKKNNLTESK